MYVPAYNAERTLRRCLESIYSQTVPFTEVLVVDDGSTDRTAEIARDMGAKIVKNASNEGLAYSRNAGISQAVNALVASVDSDCILDSRWLEVLLPYMEDETLACAGGALFEAYAESPADRWRSEHLPQHWGPHPRVNPRFLFGCNMLCRRDTILAVGGYDRALKTNGEDVDLSLKIRSRGWGLAYDPRARAYHLQRDTVRSVLDRWWRWHHPRLERPSLTNVAKNAPQYLYHGARYAFRDLKRWPGLLPLDIAFPLAQVYFDINARRPGAQA